MPISISHPIQIVRTVYSVKSFQVTANDDNSFVIDVRVSAKGLASDDAVVKEDFISHTIPPERVAKAKDFDAVKAALSGFIYADFQANVLDAK